jgi:amino acid adenylation domain-containing protein
MIADHPDTRILSHPLPSSHGLVAAFWKHHPLADQTASSLVAATLAFQAATQSAFVKLTPAGNYQIAQRGGQAQWAGDALGRRSFLSRAIQTPEDWAGVLNTPVLTVLELEMVNAAQQVRQALAPEVPLLVTVFSPVTQALMLAGAPTLQAHLRHAPQAVQAALASLSTNTLALLEAYRQVGVSGVYLACQHLADAVLPEALYLQHAHQWDAQIMAACAGFEFNLLHLHGEGIHLHALPRSGPWSVHYELHPSNPSPEDYRAACNWPAVLGLPLELWQRPQALAGEIEQLLTRFGQPGALLSNACVLPLAVSEAHIASWVRQVRQLHQALPPTFDEPGVFARFAYWAHRQPEREAVLEDASGRSWTYGELHAKALQLAAVLAHAPEQPVAVMLPAGGDLAAAFLGALACGRPYVPLDPDFPAERNQLILEQAGATELLCWATSPAVPGGLRRIHVDALPPPQDMARSNLPPQVARQGGAASIAYIVYTSGSTGQPKGVFQNQRGLLHDVDQYTQAAGLGPQDRLSWLYSPSVNGAIRDIYAALLNGASLVSLDARRLGLRALGEALARHRVSVLHAIPPLLRAFLQSEPPAQLLVSVRLAYVAGDRFFSSDLAMFWRHFPTACQIYNGIGSTECATLYRHWLVDKARLDEVALVPAGYTIPERETRLLGSNGQPVALGEVGEVEVCSRFIALGYWRQPELTQACFVPDAQRPGWRRLLTGDLARERADGLLEFVGRKDGQLKIRGHRVEPGAVEAALRQLPDVQDVAVLRTGSAHTPELSAWLVGRARPAATLREQLGQRLPAAQVPTHFYWLKRIPRLANFKTDQRALEQLAPSAQEGVEPAQQMQHTLANDLVERCWLSALHRLEPVDPQASFADLGGDSLAALNLLVAVEQALGREIPARLAHARQSLAGLRAELDASEDVALGTAQAPSSQLLFVVDARKNGYPGLLALAQALPPRLRLLRLIVPALAEPSGLDHASPADLGVQVVRQILAIQTAQGEVGQAVHLLGLSSGGRIAFEAACLLETQGIRVGSLVVGDLGPRWPDARFRHPRCPAALQLWRWRAGVLLREFLQPRDRPCTWQERRARVRERFQIQLQAQSWQPKRFGCTLTLLKAEQEPRRKHLPPDLGWQAHAACVQLRSLACTHSALLAPAQLPEVCQILLTLTAQPVPVLPPASELAAAAWRRSPSSSEGSFRPA